MSFIFACVCVPLCVRICVLVRVFACAYVLCVCAHRALADILRQQGPIPISQYDCENFAAMNGSPKDNTPMRTSSKNHYTPVHTSKSNHGRNTRMPSQEWARQVLLTTPESSQTQALLTTKAACN